ncbi:hypothetical protein Tco_1101111, partial [Tanacetum coccineum]
HPKVVDDEDVSKEEKKDDEMGSLEDRIEKMQTPIPTTSRSLRKNLSLDKTFVQELTVTISPSTATTSNDSHKKICISSKYSHLPGALRRMCKRQGYIIRDMERKCVITNEFWKVHGKVDQVLHDIAPQLAERATNVLIEGNLKRVVADTIIQERDAFQSEVPALISKEFDAQAPQIIEELFKNYDAWEEDTVIDEDEVIPKDETPELITKFQNVDKRVPTIFDHARMEATLNDRLSNQIRNAEEYAYHLEQATNFMENQIVWESRQEDIRRSIPKPLIFYGPQRNLNEPPGYFYNKDLFFLKNGNTEEKNYILSLYKIHTELFPEADLEEKMNH